MRDYTKIKAWQLADELAVKIYQVTKDFPKEEVYGLTSQMRRAAVSVPANIIEGASRNSQKDYLHFLYIARGSLTELGYHIKLSEKLSYLCKNNCELMSGYYQKSIKTLQGLINFMERENRS